MLSYQIVAYCNGPLTPLTPLTPSIYTASLSTKLPVNTGQCLLRGDGLADTAHKAY